MAPSRLERIISGKAEPSLFCRLLEDVQWRDRDEELRSLGFVPFPREGWHEFSKSIAVELLSEALTYDLCYQTKNFPRSTAEEISAEFVDHFHWQARFFANCETPWTKGLSAWSFNGLTKATVDTGIVVKDDDLFSGIFWISSWD